MWRSCLIQTQLYIYSQVIPFGSVFAGKAYQFPLIWESSLVTLVMIPAGVLLYRDDTGRTVAEKMAQRVRCLPLAPGPRQLSGHVRDHQRRLLRYGAGLRPYQDTRIGHIGGLPVALPEAKVYDPQGFYETNGQTRTVLGRDLVGLDERATERTSHRAAARCRRPMCPGGHG